MRILAPLHHYNTCPGQLSAKNLGKEPGFIPSPLNEPVPEMDWSAPECPTLWYYGADTSALKRQREEQRIEREGQTGSQPRGSKREMGEVRLERVRKRVNRSEREARSKLEGNSKTWMRKRTEITWRVIDSLSKKEEGRRVEQLSQRDCLRMRCQGNPVWGELDQRLGIQRRTQPTGK